MSAVVQHSAAINNNKDKNNSSSTLQIMIATTAVQ